MKKRVMALLLSAVMIVTMFSACGNDAGNNTTDPSGSTNVTEAATSTTAPTKTPEAEASPTPVPDSQTGVDDEVAFTEAPDLSALVGTGELPAVEDRLPVASDIMVEQMESVGNYGGSFSFAYTKAGWNTGKPIEEGLFRFKSDGSIEPNVAKGYDVNEDATVYTIYLREGMKWSDGVDFTADDCVFFYDHMCVPQTFGKSLWDCFKVTNPETGEETTASFAKVDDYTFTVTFEYPKASFLENLAINAKWCYAPMHYHMEILPEFIGEEAAQAKAEEMGFADIAAMGKETGYYFWNVPGVPTLNPYVLSTEEGKNDVNGDYYEFVRNPYYWKVDADGQQLPYVDKMEITRIADDSQGLLYVLDGTTTVSSVGWSDMATLSENAEVGGYRMVNWASTAWTDLASELQLNQTAEDEDLRALFQNIDFRHALSICVDRDEYAMLISDGWSEGRQSAPAEGALGYSEEWATKWTEYDVEGAKTLLEGCGLVMGDDGFYDFANGKDFVLNISAFTDAATDDQAQILMKYFKEAGINSTYTPVSKDLLNQNLPANQVECLLGPVAPAETVSIALRPDTLVPVRNYACWYGQVGDWYTSGGTDGVEPTGDLLELCNLYDELKATVDTEKRTEISLEMLKLHEENTWIIGYMAPTTVLWAIDDKLMNFPESSIYCDEFRGLGIAHLQCCYFAE